MELTYEGIFQWIVQFNASVLYNFQINSTIIKIFESVFITASVLFHSNNCSLNWNKLLSAFMEQMNPI